MKCPHCNTGIAEAFAHVKVAGLTEVKGPDGSIIAPNTVWTVTHMRCSECKEAIIRLHRYIGTESTTYPAYPSSKVRPVPADVVDPYKQDFIEACKVLADSPKASAALSRRCLQAILRNVAGIKGKSLQDEIEQAIASGKLPSHICEDLNAVRVIGNFSAHPTKSTATGEIIDVESDEAEWNLDVLELLFDFYFVQPAISARRKAAVNVKLKAAGKPELS